jgi:hypothetical protein
VRAPIGVEPIVVELATAAAVRAVRRAVRRARRDPVAFCMLALRWSR